MIPIFKAFSCKAKKRAYQLEKRSHKCRKRICSSHVQRGAVRSYTTRSTFLKKRHRQLDCTVSMMTDWFLGKKCTCSEMARWLVAKQRKTSPWQGGWPFWPQGQPRSCLERQDGRRWLQWIRGQWFKKNVFHCLLNATVPVPFNRAFSSSLRIRYFVPKKKYLTK